MSPTVCLSEGWTLCSSPMSVVTAMPVLASCRVRRWASRSMPQSLIVGAEGGDLREEEGEVALMPLVAPVLDHGGEEATV